jgi:galactokinase
MDKRATVAASPRTDGSMRFFAADTGERKRTSASALKYRHEDHFGSLAKGILSRLHTLGAHIAGVDVTVQSDIPPGIGLAASQAIGVAMALAVARVCGFSLGPVEAAQVAHFAEHSFAELPVGLSGFLASAVTRRDTMMLLDTHRLDWQYIPFDLDQTVIYGINTHAPSALNAQEEAERQIDCVECLSMLSEDDHGCSFQEFTVDQLYGSLGRVPEAARRYCLHIVSENTRVLGCADALRHRDPQWMGKLLGESHESLRDLYEGSSPEVDWIVKHSQALHGVYGARLAGGSTGTCALALAVRDSGDLIRELMHEYERIFGFHPDVIECMPDEGVREETGRIRASSAYQ